MYALIFVGVIFEFKLFVPFYFDFYYLCAVSFGIFCMLFLKFECAVIIDLL